MLQKLGLSPERLRVEYVSAAEGVKFAEIVKEINAQRNALGDDRIKAENEKVRPILENMLKKKAEPIVRETPKTSVATMLVASSKEE
jgi:hypothetical protein